MRALEHHEHVVINTLLRALPGQVGRQHGEEDVRDRDQALVPALAVRDEHAPVPDLHMLEPQPEDFTAAQPTVDHQGDHGPVPVGAQRPRQSSHFHRCGDPRELAWRPDQRCTAPSTSTRARGACVPCAEAARDRVAVTDPAQEQVLEQRGDRRQPPLDLRRGQAGLAVREAHHVPAPARRTLSLDETQHISDHHLLRRLADDAKEHLQVERLRGQRVRSDPGRCEPQILIQERLTQARHASSRAHQARHERPDPGRANLLNSSLHPPPTEPRNRRADHLHIKPFFARELDPRLPW